MSHVKSRFKFDSLSSLGKSCKLVDIINLSVFIRVKATLRRKHEWASVPVPTSKTSMLVTGLQSATSYQFSVLPQNKLGSGPFSEIVTVRTLGQLLFS